MKRLAGLILALGAIATVAVPQAHAAPKPIPFCMPDLDGHCRYCEIRFAPPSIVCLY